MSDEKQTTKQYTQEGQSKHQTDLLDAQYKQIGISAVSGAFEAAKHHAHKDLDEQMK